MKVNGTGNSRRKPILRLNRHRVGDLKSENWPWYTPNTLIGFTRDRRHVLFGDLPHCSVPDAATILGRAIESIL